MPSVTGLSGLGGFDVWFYSNEHEPKHIHVSDGSGEAVYDLNCPDGPLDLREKQSILDAGGQEDRPAAVSSRTDAVRSLGKALQ